MANYPFIRAYGNLMGSNESYINDKISRARRERAPADAWSYDSETGAWRTLGDLEARGATGNFIAADTARQLRRYAE